jgi:hypothetical protein
VDTKPGDAEVTLAGSASNRLVVGMAITLELVLFGDTLNGLSTGATAITSQVNWKSVGWQLADVDRFRWYYLQQQCPATCVYAERIHERCGGWS